MDQLPPHSERTRQPFEPDPVGHRRQPLRDSRHRFPLLPLIDTDRVDCFKTAPSAPFLIPALFLISAFAQSNWIAARPVIMTRA
nr:hypothetical protein [Rhizobium lusitanum]